MDCQDIQNALGQLKVNSKGAIRGQMRVIDKIHSMHLKKIDSERRSIGEEGDLEHECSTIAQCFIVAQMFNLQRQAPFLPMQC